MGPTDPEGFLLLEFDDGSQQEGDLSPVGIESGEFSVENPEHVLEGGRTGLRGKGVDGCLPDAWVPVLQGDSKELDVLRTAKVTDDLDEAAADYRRLCLLELAAKLGNHSRSKGGEGARGALAGGSLEVRDELGEGACRHDASNAWSRGSLTLCLLPNGKWGTLQEARGVRGAADGGKCLACLMFLPSRRVQP